MELRVTEQQQILAALLAGRSLLVLGDSGSGKSHLATLIGKHLGAEGFRIAIANYSGAAKDTLTAIADQLDVPTVQQLDETKTKPLTAAQLKDSLKDDLRQSKTLLIADDAHRWSASLRYWLEDLHRAGTLLLLFAVSPPTKDIFLKLPIVELPPLTPDTIRQVMQREALDQGMRLTPAQFAELQTRAGGNLALAKRVVYEELLGITETRTTEEQAQYVDGTPFLIALLAILGIVRFVGLGLGDRALYLIGGMLTLAALVIRALLYAANRGKRRL